jgi:hypothetical protein
MVDGQLGSGPDAWGWGWGGAEDFDGDARLESGDLSRVGRGQWER